MKTKSFIRENKKILISAGVLLLLIAAWLIPSPLSSRISPFARFVDAEADLENEVDTVGMVLPDGSVYDGNLIMGTEVRNGYGRLRKPNGSVYEGEWRHNQLTYGTYTTPDFVYEGHFNNKLQSDGYGILTYTDPRLGGVAKLENEMNRVREYSGNWRDGVKQGLGRTVYADGTMEFGEYDKGVYQPVAGQKFEPGDHVYGMDVSHHQTEIDWNNLALYCNAEGDAYKGKVKKGKYRQPVFFVYVKATEGADYIDPTYSVRIEEAERHGVVKGAYHFMRLGSDPKAQVMNFCSTASWVPGDMPPALDIEDEKEMDRWGGERVRKWVYTWLEGVEERMNVRPIIYTTEGLRDRFLRQDPRFSKYQCWIARYNTKGPKNEVWRIWQFTETGKISGYNKPVDGNIYKGTYSTFRHYLSTLGSSQK